MSQNVIAAQMYTVRDFTKTVEGFSDSVAKIGAIGYTAAQVSSIGPIPAADVKKICDDHGITIVNTHVAWPRLQEDIAGVIEEHHLWQCKHVAVGSMPRHFIEAGEEGIYQFVKEATEVGRTLHEAGLTFSYHNHSFEFMRYGDKCGLEILFDETDPPLYAGGAGHVLDPVWGRRRVRLDFAAKGPDAGHPFQRHGDGWLAGSCDEGSRRRKSELAGHPRRLP